VAPRGNELPAEDRPPTTSPRVSAAAGPRERGWPIGRTGLQQAHLTHSFQHLSNSRKLPIQRIRRWQQHPFKQDRKTKDNIISGQMTGMDGTA